MSVPSAESRLLTIDPGPFTFILCSNVRCLGSLAAAIYQAAAPHDLGRQVQHRVNLLAAKVQKVSRFLEREQAGAH